MIWIVLDEAQTLSQTFFDASIDRARAELLIRLYILVRIVAAILFITTSAIV